MDVHFLDPACPCNDNPVAGVVADTFEPGATNVERCSRCERYPDDLAAARAWAAHAGGAWIVSDWEPAAGGATYADGQTVRAYSTLDQAFADLRDRIGQPDSEPDELVATEGRVEYVEPAPA